MSLTRRVSGGLVRKTIRVLTDRPVVECRYALEDVRVPVVALEFNVCLRDERRIQGAQEQRDVRRLTLEEGWSGIRAQLTIDPLAIVYIFPVETVSESEGGMERTFQGLCLVCLWEPPASDFRSCVQWDVSA